MLLLTRKTGHKKDTFTKMALRVVNKYIFLSKTENRLRLGTYISIINMLMCLFAMRSK